VAAFRDKVWLAHPDRGGNEQAFIDLCSAYQTVLSEVRLSKRGLRPAPEARGSRPSGRQPPDETPIPERPRKRESHERRPKPPDKNWEPDLVLSADVGRDGQPAPSADPTWDPDLIVADEANSDRRPSQPPDPSWKPDIVLNDDLMDHDARDIAAAPPHSPDAFRSLFQRISAGAPLEKNESLITELARVMRALLILVFVAWIVGTIWLCKTLWDESTEAARTKTPGDFHQKPR
jgi:hypothetical protein